MIMNSFLGPTQDWPENGDPFERNLEIAQSYMENSLWSAAVPFLCAAHELIRTRLRERISDPIDTMFDFSTTCVLLILAYKKLTRITEAFEVYALAIDTVENLEAPAELKAECIENINFQFPDTPPSTRKPSERLMAH